jgi:hypothetical protein
LVDQPRKVARGGRIHDITLGSAKCSGPVLVDEWRLALGGYSKLPSEIRSWRRPSARKA